MWASQSGGQQQPGGGGQTSAKTLGMTSAITLAGPKLIDLQRTTELIEALKPFNVKESEQELNHRYRSNGYAFNKFCRIIKWAYHNIH